ncbi:succinate dehydrogenase assembly factor 4, mitochondrial-like [Neocloeon triangulifer]|uniref:succinate dehydrogenase assembly factor 4, mitochondrial-like n=1 Tax=Neocloeon triangulifer TaxID=2078957 RepID=UPI00286F2982|nr:succinate dehydrogenase assembly factor 4, mitochondrial-like [Neocloeon triangulifer]XP_059487256.1 succinate dehydrogenase assembly factor 4, mitochondrial-like [Neocloeon triangulifer]
MHRSIRCLQFASASATSKLLKATSTAFLSIQHESTSGKKGGPFFPPARPTGPNPKKEEEVAKKLRAKTPIGKLDEPEEGAKHPHQEKDPLPPFPNNTNPNTGEVGGPRGPEPTRFGDWERKGRVSDF